MFCTMENRRNYKKSLDKMGELSCESEVHSIMSNEALVRLINDTEYPMVQENGQRKFGPPPNWFGNPPAKGCEIFVGRLPRDCYEDELVPVFSQIGTIYELRLMMDFSGSNRGYAFVMYTNLNDAKTAIRQLNNYEIRKGKLLGVVKSVDNCRLFVGGIPRDKDKSQVTVEMSKITDGVSDVILYRKPCERGKNRGFAFVEYKSHRAAAMARRKLIPGRIQLWDQSIKVDWAEPEADVDEAIMAQVKILYVRNLSESTTEDRIREYFSQFNDGVERTKKLRDFAFVHYRTRAEAEEAMDNLNGTLLDDSEIEVTWAKPPEAAIARHSRKVAMNDVRMAMAPISFLGHPNQYNWLASTSQAYVQNGHRMLNGYNTPVVMGRCTATGRRNARGFVTSYDNRKQSQYRIYSLYPGMHFFPPPPPTNIVHGFHPSRSPKYPTQLLFEFCAKNGYGEPTYELHVPSVQQGVGNADTRLYYYKVMIPGYGCIQPPNKLLSSSEDAKQHAAQWAYYCLQNALYGASSSDGVPYKSISSSPSVDSTNGNDYSWSPTADYDETLVAAPVSRQPRFTATTNLMNGNGAIVVPDFVSNSFAFMNSKSSLYSSGSAVAPGGDVEVAHPSMQHALLPGMLAYFGTYLPAQLPDISGTQM